MGGINLKLYYLGMRKIIVAFLRVCGIHHYK